MKPFDLEKAKAGAPVCTRNGLKVKILRFDVKNLNYQIAALVTDKNGIEYYENYTKDGRYYVAGYEDDMDLVMASIKHKGWVNVYPDDTKFTIGYKTGSNIFPTKEIAKQVSAPNCIATISIEWEE